MRKLYIENEMANYLHKVLGVSHLIVPESQQATKEPVEFIINSSTATYLVIVDEASVDKKELSLELLLKLTDAFKMPKSGVQLVQINAQWKDSKLLSKLESDIRKTTKILCLGPNAKKLMESFSKDLLPNQRNSFFKQQIVCSHSPESMLDKAEFKKDTWVLMQDLMKA